jgi:hypothetical protein
MKRRTASPIEIEFELFFAKITNAGSLGQDMAGKDRRRRLSSGLIHRIANAISRQAELVKSNRRLAIAEAVWVRGRQTPKPCI